MMSYYLGANTRAGRVTGGGSRLRVCSGRCRGQKACLHAQERSELAKGVKIVVKGTMERWLAVRQAGIRLPGLGCDLLAARGQCQWSRNQACVEYYSPKTMPDVALTLGMRFLDLLVVGTAPSVASVALRSPSPSPAGVEIGRETSPKIREVMAQLCALSRMLSMHV